jgi:hypothetical protein
MRSLLLLVVELAEEKAIAQGKAAKYGAYAEMGAQLSGSAKGGAQTIETIGSFF